MNPEGRIRTLLAQSTWKKPHGNALPPMSSETGNEPDYAAMGMTKSQYEAMLANEADRQRRQGYIRSVTTQPRAKHMWHPEHDDLYRPPE